MSSSLFQRVWTRIPDFTSLTGAINLPVLRAAIDVAMPLEPPDTFELVDLDTVLARWSTGVPSSVELAAADAAVAAHLGTATTGQLQSFSSTAESTNATTSFVDKGVSDFVSSPLTGGRWGLRFAAQLRTTTVVVNSGARAILRAGVGGSLSGADDRAYTDHSIFSATQPQLWAYFDVFNITAGQVLRFQPRFARSGAAATAAMLEFRADLFLIG